MTRVAGIVLIAIILTTAGCANSLVSEVSPTGVVTVTGQNALSMQGSVSRESDGIVSVTSTGTLDLPAK